MGSVVSETRVIVRIEDVRNQLESIFAAISPNGVIVLPKRLMDALFEDASSAWDEVRIECEDEMTVGSTAALERLQPLKLAQGYVEALAALVAFKMETPLYLTQLAPSQVLPLR